MLLSRMGAFSWNGTERPSDGRFGWAKGVTKAPGQRQAWSSEVGRGPSLSNQPHGADDCVDLPWEEGREAQAKRGQPLSAHCKMPASAFAEVASSSSLRLVEKGVSYFSKEE